MVASKKSKTTAKTKAKPKPKEKEKAKAKTKAKPKNRDLVIVESPGKVKTISKVLGRSYVVKASVGHVRDLNTSKKGDKKDAIVVGVAKDYSPVYINLDGRKKIIEDLKKLSESADKVYLCPDPDREGEAIAWHLKEALELKEKQSFRVTFDEITPRGIKAAFENPRKIDMDLVNAQQARRVLDRIVGYKLSPLLWEKISRGLSAGRVQSVAVRLIVERERQIDAFVADEYWKIGAVFRYGDIEFEADLRSLLGRNVVSSAEDLKKYKSQDKKLSVSGIMRILLDNKKDVEQIAAALKKAAYRVSSFNVKEVADRPYPPFATSQLQQAAANRFGFSASRTMKVAQSLYMGLPIGELGPTALITYMRTDSFRISQDALTECRDQITSKYGAEFLPEKPNFYSSRKGAQDAHECIRPTHVELAPKDIKAHLSDEQYKLYNLIWSRFVSSQMRPAIFDATTCDIKAKGPDTRNAVFRATGRVLKFEGWLKVYGGAKAVTASHLDASSADREKGDEISDNTEEETDSGKKEGSSSAKAKKKAPQILPAMEVDDEVEQRKILPAQKFTQPPPRYTEASLVKMLEREGIGRPSTYAAIISTIQDRGYVEKTGTGGRGPFRATDLGTAVNDKLVNFFDHSIMNLNFTRKMETELDKIEEAHLDWRQVLNEFYDPFISDLETATEKMVATKGQGVKTDVECPECGKFMEKRLNRFGFYLRCSEAPECKGLLRLDSKGKIQEQQKPQATGIKCDLCGSDVVKTSGRFGPYLACEKYIEKQCTFTMKLNKEGHPIRKFNPLSTDIKCPKCESEMYIRITWRGKNRKPFLSCSKYPKCRNAMDLPEELSEEGEKAMEQYRANDAKNKADLKVFQETLAEAESESEAESEAPEETAVASG